MTNKNLREYLVYIRFLIRPEERFGTDSWLEKPEALGNLDGIVGYSRWAQRNTDASIGESITFFPEKIVGYGTDNNGPYLIYELAAHFVIDRNLRSAPMRWGFSSTRMIVHESYLIFRSEKLGHHDSQFAYSTEPYIRFEKQRRLIDITTLDGFVAGEPEWREAANR